MGCYKAVTWLLLDCNKVTRLLLPCVNRFDHGCYNHVTRCNKGCNIAVFCKLGCNMVVWGDDYNHVTTMLQPNLQNTAMLQPCYMVVTRLLHGCYKAVTWLLQGCYMVVTRLLHGCYKAVTR